jgi:cytochrome oxidase assembly protein ShyY1
VYRFLTGNHGDLKHDPFAFPVLVAQGFITGAILMGYGIWQMAKDRKKRMAGEK